MLILNIMYIYRNSLVYLRVYHDYFILEIFIFGEGLMTINVYLIFI